MGSQAGSIQLSEREREVLFLAAEGLTDKEIAARLEIKTKTVRTYWDRVRGKLGAASRTQALALALRSAYDQLAMREEQLRTFVDAMPVAFFAFADDLTVLACNKEAQEMTGYSEQELRGTRNIYALAFPDLVSRTRLVREWKLSRGEFRNWELPITRKDGSHGIVSWSSCARNHPVSGWRTWAIGVDVTPLREAEQKLRFLVHAAVEGIWMVDPNFQTQFANVRMAEILGTDVATLERTSPTDYIAPEDLSSALAVIAAGGAEGVPFRFRRGDGCFVDVTKWLRKILSPAGETIGFLILATEAIAASK